jgi:ATP-dependent Clp protease ATP-binding subunit ClpA
MFERFSRSARATVKSAGDVAAADGSETVEAQHLLLALIQHADDPTARALDTLGISERAVRAALEEEFTHALQTVGVTATVPQQGPSRSGRSGRATPKWGQSAKLALVRALQVTVDRGYKRIEDRQLLIALSLAEAGVVPRVLHTLGVTPSDIDTALR